MVQYVKHKSESYIMEFVPKLKLNLLFICILRIMQICGGVFCAIAGQEPVLLLRGYGVIKV